MVGNAEKALAITCQETGAIVREYTAAPLFELTGKAEGYHQWMVEFEQQPHDLTLFAKRLDMHLQHVNSDYEAKRYKGISLAPLQNHSCSQRFVLRLDEAKRKLGGQHKVLVLAMIASY